MGGKRLAAVTGPGGFHVNKARPYDEWTIESWRTEPRLSRLNSFEVDEAEQTPALWKDLTLASGVAVLLWVAAAIVFG